MSATAIGINHDGIGLSNALIGRPLAAQGNIDIHEVRRTLLQASGEQLDTGIMLVLARTMARTAGDEEDVLFIGGRQERRREQEEAEE